MNYSYRAFLYQKFLTVSELFDNPIELRDWLLTFLFYFFLSSSIEDLILTDKGIVYQNLSDQEAEEKYKDFILANKGYFLLPSELFSQVSKSADEDLDVRLQTIFENIERSTATTGWSKHFNGLLSNLDLSADLITKDQRLKKIKACLQFVAEANPAPIGSYNLQKSLSETFNVLLKFFRPKSKDLLGQYITPKKIANLLAGLVVDKAKQNPVICDPVCGGGTLLLAVKEKYPKSIVYGQDNNSQICRLAKMNCIIHGLAKWEFAILTDDLITSDNFFLNGPYDIIVADPTIYTNLDETDLIFANQERFMGLKVADFGKRLDAFTVLFTMQALASGGIAAILVYPGLLHKDGAYCELRKLLIEENLVDTVICLPSNVVFHTQLNPQVLVLKKNRLDKQVLFIDASKEYSPVRDLETNKTSVLDSLTNEGVAKIQSVYHNRDSQPSFSQLVNLDLIKKNNYLLSVASYVSRLT